MRSRIAVGLFVFAALAVTRAHAQQLQWRAFTPRAEPDIRGGNAPGVTLAKPIPVTPAPTTSGSPVVPVSFRSVPVARNKVETVYPEPLPSGPSFTVSSQNGQKPVKDEEIKKAPTPIPAADPNGNGMIIPYGGDGSIIVNGDGGCGCDCCDPCCCGCARCYPFCICPPCFCCPIDGCNTRRIFWFTAEYLLWNVSADAVSPLLTTGTAVNAITGVAPLGDPNTVVLAGNNVLPGTIRSGARFTLGGWCPWWEQWGGEVSYMFLGQANRNFLTASAGNPLFARPFVNSLNGLQSGFPIASPVGATVAPFAVNPYAPLGSSATFQTTASSYFWGVEANVRRKLLCGPGFWADALLGYRHLQLDEALGVFTTLRPTGGAPLLFQDQFNTRNAFNGIQIGIDGQFYFWSRWSIGGFAKLAVGNINEQLSIAGTTNVQQPPAGGFLALQSNIGNTNQNRFGIVPELGAKLGWNLTDHLQFFVGYDAIFINEVLRVGQQVDAQINPNLLPGLNRQGQGGANRPAVLFQRSNFWAQGVNFGVTYTW